MLDPRNMTLILVVAAAFLLGGIIYILVSATPRELQAFIIQHNMYQSINELIVVVVAYIFGALSLIYMYSTMRKKSMETIKTAGLALLLLFISLTMLSYLYYLKNAR
ncbi:MAG: hypothetical protein DRJ98_04835 [Thermoprotei archaeon]|nr:MAG: hypothetical protein DRJ98_04835 [Thermoprotei archaeon]